MLGTLAKPPDTPGRSPKGMSNCCKMSPLGQGGLAGVENTLNGVGGWPESLGKVCIASVEG